MQPFVTVVECVLRAIDADYADAWFAIAGLAVKSVTLTRGIKVTIRWLA